MSVTSIEITDDTRFATVIPISVVCVLEATTAPTSVAPVPTDLSVLFLNVFAMFIL
jgi:hypothetical protein